MFPLSLDPATDGDAATIVTFHAQLPALGVRRFTISAAAAAAAGRAQTPSDLLAPVPAAPRPASQIVLENSELKLVFDPSGELSAVTCKSESPPLELAVTLAPRWYKPSTVGDDGAYDFHSDARDPAAKRFPGDDGSGTPTVTRGAVYDEVTRAVDRASNVHITTRLHHDSAGPGAGPGGAVEVFMTVGPIGIWPSAVPGRGNATGREVVLQLNTSIPTGGRFLTDSSGMELVERKLGNGTFDNDALNASQPGDNWYPTTVRDPWPHLRHCRCSQVFPRANQARFLSL